MFLLHPDLAVHQATGRLTIEDRDLRLSFEGSDALLAGTVIRSCGRAASVEAVAEAAARDVPTTEAMVSLLERESFVLRMDYFDVMHADEAIIAIKHAALFWNKHVMSQNFPLRLFSGEATRIEVLGWGIEFYHFVRAAREYMAQGASRTDGPSAALSKLWDHFVEEAFHDEIFLDGLVDCGLDRGDIEGRPPLASTMALLNHLWECAEEGDIDYTAVFAVMQPGLNQFTHQDIKKKYDLLRASYSLTAFLFDAFEKHESIDVDLDHSNLTIEPLIRLKKFVTRSKLTRIVNKIRRTAEFFIIFLRVFLNTIDQSSNFDIVRYRTLA